MSEFQIATDTMTVYAVNSSRPPQVWMSEWALLNSERIMGGDIPEGFRQVEAEEYEAALQAQADGVERKLLSSAYDERVMLSRQRKALRDAGLSVEVARILVPDPTGDYSIDEA